MSCLAFKLAVTLEDFLQNFLDTDTGAGADAIARPKYMEQLVRIEVSVLVNQAYTLLS